MRREKGFTLVELMITIAVLVLVSTMGTMMIGNRGEKNSMMRVKTSMGTFMRGAVDKAYQEGLKHRVDFISTPASIVLSRWNGTNYMKVRELQLPSNLRYNITPTDSAVFINDTGAFTNELGQTTGTAIGVPAFKYEVHKRTVGTGSALVLIQGRTIRGVNIGKVEVFLFEGASVRSNPEKGM